MADEQRSALDVDDIHRDKLAMLGQLTAGVAHELNNPVGYIASNLNTLGKYIERLLPLVAELQKAAGEAGNGIVERHRWRLMAEDLPLLARETSEGAELLKTLVADLKTLGRTSQAREHCDPCECVVSALNVLNHKLKHGFTVHRDLQPQAPLPLVRAQIIQACTNIIHNAIQAMGGQGEIDIRCWSDADGCHITIENSGPAIASGDRERIFQPYFTTKAGRDGSGLGLPIVARIMHEHGGDIRLDDGERLGGPRFTLTLPVDHG